MSRRRQEHVPIREPSGDSVFEQDLHFGTQHQYHGCRTFFSLLLSFIISPPFRHEITFNKNVAANTETIQVLASRNPDPKTDPLDEKGREEVVSCVLHLLWAQAMIRQ